MRIYICFLLASAFQLYSSKSINDTIDSNNTNHTSNISLFDTSKILTLNNSNFDRHIRKGRLYPSLVLFTIRKCSLCNHIVQTFENVSDILSVKQKELKLFKVDCFASSWTAMRFRIDHLPIIAYVYNGSVSYYEGNMTTSEIVSFALSSNKTFDVFPEPMNYFRILQKVNQGVDELISPFMKKHGIPWTSLLSSIVFGSIVLLIAYLDWKFVSYCCRFKKNEKKQKHVHSNNCSHKHAKVNAHSSKPKQA